MISSTTLAIAHFIYTLNPNAKIILITPRKAYGASVFPEHWWEANTAGGNDYYLKDYVAAVKAIGEFLSLPVCDWFADSNTNQYNLAADSVDVALHPNDTGYQKLANLPNLYILFASCLCVAVPIVTVPPPRLFPTTEM